jgi:hypothetical protein
LTLDRLGDYDLVTLEGNDRVGADSVDFDILAEANG